LALAALVVNNTGITLAGNSKFIHNHCGCQTLSGTHELGCSITQSLGVCENTLHFTSLIMLDQSGYQQAHYKPITSLVTQQMVPVLVVVMQLIQKRTPHLVSVVLVILVISVGCSRLYIYIYINSPSIE